MTESIKNKVIKQIVKRAYSQLVKFDCRIRIVSLDVTDRCNASCQKCLLRQLKPFPDMTLENFTMLLTMLPKSVKSLMWAGMGEPLLNPDTSAMICYAKKHGFYTILYTNGTIPHENLKGYIDEINYNSDTFNEKKHNSG